MDGDSSVLRTNLSYSILKKERKREMNRLKRALSMLLAVAIFFTCSAVNVFAQSQTEILPQYIEVSEFVSTQSSSVVSKSISRYNVISNQNPKHIISVARGQTIEMELTTDLEFS